LKFVVRDHEHPLVGVLGVVRLELGRGLEAKGRLAAPLFSKDEGRRWVGGATEKLVPGRVVNLVQTTPLEDRVGLRILFAKGIAGNSVVPQKLFGPSSSLRVP